MTASQKRCVICVLGWQIDAMNVIRIFVLLNLLYSLNYYPHYRCLSPGMYAHHLDRWLIYFPSQQISIIDGEQLRLDPVTSMTKLQHFMKIRPVFDYSLHLRYFFLLFVY